MKKEQFTDFISAEGIIFSGYGQVPTVLFFDPDLSPESKGLYAYMASYTGGGGVSAFPSRDTIFIASVFMIMSFDKVE